MKTTLTVVNKMILNFLKQVGLIFALVSLAASPSFASSISVYPMSADLTGQTRYQDIQVQNTGNDTAYVAITIYLINNPGMPDQSVVKLNDNPYQVGLIVTPNKMVIPQGQMRIARALYIGKSVSQDAVYEVKFTPVSGQLVAIGNSNTDVNAGLELVIAYGVGIIVRPAHLEPQIAATRDGTSLTLTNTGNTTITIGNCTPDQNIAATLYPGNTQKITLTQASAQNCQEQVLNNHFSAFKIN